MVEVFPQAASPQKLEAQLQKLVAAFISVAEDLTEDQEQQEAKREKGNRRKEGSGGGMPPRSRVVGRQPDSPRFAPNE